MAERIRERIEVRGVVQGVGFRPFVWKVANELGLTGWVANHSSGVLIEAQGFRAPLNGFQQRLRAGAPRQAVVENIETIVIDTIVDEVGFSIIDSFRRIGESSLLSPDIATCDDCLREFRDTANRRYRYPFINCTNCGPRFTITEEVPYDRETTTMKVFPMCELCRTEYDNPADRRFHAQPNACHACGPKIWLLETEHATTSPRPNRSKPANVDAVLRRFREFIRAGCIVAVKGIGGFHLVCDATNVTAVRRLRARKGRVDKPFAIMVESLDSLTSFAVVEAAEREQLLNQARPIVLLRKRCDISEIELNWIDGVAPGIRVLGAMLPYSALHALLVEGLPPLVMTSGNHSEEPIARKNAEAIERLGHLADAFLMHDRDIHVVADDSVVRIADTGVLPIRRSRGYAPMPLRMPHKTADHRLPSVLAAGGELKATFCITQNQYATMSQHLGDMENYETLEAMQRSVEHFLHLFRIEPELVAADLHPDYLSSRWARQYAKALEVPFVPVVHHHAHLAALMVEHGLGFDEEVLGVCFDGSGFGTDGAIWGGEFLLTTGQDFQRLAHLQYFPLPGGDAAIREPYRVALALLFSAEIPWDAHLACVEQLSATHLKILRQQLERQVACPLTSSMGRLFDGVASLIGLRHSICYEAQAAVELESLATASMADPSVRCVEYEFSVADVETVRPWQIDASTLVRQILLDIERGVSAGIIAARFHHAVARMVESTCMAARQESGIDRVGLTGGVFQNVLLLRLVSERLHNQGFKVLTHQRIPPNDGGIALGQAWLALNRPR